MAQKLGLVGVQGWHAGRFERGVGAAWLLALVLASAACDAGADQDEASGLSGDAAAAMDAGDDDGENLSDAGSRSQDDAAVGDDGLRLSRCDCAQGVCATSVDPESGDEVRACICDRGWAGEMCDECAAGYAGDDCTECAADYLGSEEDPSLCNPDPCADQPCGDGGRCVLESDDTGIVVAACSCLEGFDGKLCADCAEGYKGTDCATCADGYVKDDAGACVLRACAEVACGEHGSCIDRKGTGVCVCETGWTGDACDECVDGYTLDQGSCVIGPCLGVDCGDGTCIALTGTPACDCPRGYVGLGCDTCAKGFIEVTTGDSTTCANVLPVADRRLAAQFDAAATGTFTLTGALVDAWDASRGDGVLWPESNPKRPNYVLFPPAVRFDGAQWMNAPTKTIRTGNNYTIIVVASWKPDGGRQTILDSIALDGEGFPEAFALDALDENTVRFRHRGSSNAKSDVVTSTDFHAKAGRQLIIARRVPFGDGHVISVSNGQTATTVASPGGSFEHDVQTLVARCHGEAVGQFCPLKGSLHELLFFEGSLSTAQLDAIEDYLRVKWSL